MASSLREWKPVEEGGPVLVEEMEGGLKALNREGHEFLKPYVTNTDRQVFALTGLLPPVAQAAAMARLSRSPNGYREIVADEGFLNPDIRRAVDLTRRVVTEYGDDSVQQLLPISAVAENVSQIVTKDIEHGRLAAYLERSTRYVYYDKKDPDGNYLYVIPAELKGPLLEDYKTTQDKIFGIYSEIVHGLIPKLKAANPKEEGKSEVAWSNSIRAKACDLARALLPVSVKSTVGIFASGQAYENLVMRLRGAETEEARSIGNQLLAEARQVSAVFLERADKPDRGGAYTAYQIENRINIRRLAGEILDQNSEESLLDSPAEISPGLKLVDYHPKDEMTIIADMMYPATGRSIEELRRILSGVSRERQEEVFWAYVGERRNRRHKPGRAFENIHYYWDGFTDFGSFRDLQRHRIVDDLSRQNLTPDYGYNIPDDILEYGYRDRFVEAFNLAEGLYQRLKKQTNPVVAQYATLLGHLMRWKVSYNAREAFHIHEIRTSGQGHPDYRKIVQGAHQQAVAVHPLTTKAMKFFNSEEDITLGRLESEEASQRKLGRLINEQADF